MRGAPRDAARVHAYVCFQAPSEARQRRLRVKSVLFVECLCMRHDERCYARLSFRCYTAP